MSLPFNLYSENIITEPLEDSNDNNHRQWGGYTKQAMCRYGAVLSTDIGDGLQRLLNEVKEVKGKRGQKCLLGKASS